MADMITMSVPAFLTKAHVLRHTYVPMVRALGAW